MGGSCWIGPNWDHVWARILTAAFLLSVPVAADEIPPHSWDPSAPAGRARSPPVGRPRI